MTSFELLRSFGSVNNNNERSFYLFRGDQHDDAIVEYFLSENMLGYFPKVLENPDNLQGEIARQVLQTLSLLIQNIQDTETVYYIFSNNHLNRILAMEFSFDEEILSYYVNLLKTVSLRLDEHSVEFFLMGDDPTGKTFTLYAKALAFGSCQDAMVRAAVRNITLSSFSIPSKSVWTCFEHEDTLSYFRMLSDDVIATCCSVDALLLTNSPDSLEIEQLLCQINDELIYFNEVCSTGVPVVTCIAFRAFWRNIILDLCVNSLTCSAGKLGRSTIARRIRPHTALLILETYIQSILNDKILLLLVSILFGGDSLTMAEAILQDHPSLDVVDILITDSPSQAHDVRQCLIGYLEHGDPSLVSGVLRLIATILDNKSTSHDLLSTIGFIPFNSTRDQDSWIHTNGYLENTRVESFPMARTDIFESVSSACFSDRHGEILNAIFSSMKSAYRSPFALMNVVWILQKMKEADELSLMQSLKQFEKEAENLLYSYHKHVLAKLVLASDWVDIVPLLIKYYWSRQIKMNASFSSTRSFIRSWKAECVLERIESVGFHSSNYMGLNVCLLTIMGFISRYQIYQLVSKGIIDTACPFPGPLLQTVVDNDVQIGVRLKAPSGAFPINSNQAVVKIWQSSDTPSMWYDQVISIAVFQKSTEIELFKVTNVIPIVAAKPTRQVAGHTLHVSVRPALPSILRHISRNPLGLYSYRLDEKEDYLLEESKVEIAFVSQDDCEFVEKLVHQIVEDLRDRCSNHVASLLPS